MIHKVNVVKKMLVESYMPWAPMAQKVRMEQVMQDTLNNLSTQVSNLRDGCLGPEEFQIKVDTSPVSAATVKGSWMAPRKIESEPRWTEVRFVVESGKVDIRVLRGLYGERKFLYIVSDLHMEGRNATPEQFPFSWPSIMNGCMGSQSVSTGTYGLFEYNKGSWETSHRWNINWAHALLWPVR